MDNEPLEGTSLPNSNEPLEEIFILVRPYWVAFLPWLLFGVAMVMVGAIFVILIARIFPDLTTGPSRNILTAIASAYFLFILPIITVAFIDFYYDISIVTDLRIIDINQQELFSRHVSELSLPEVEDVSVKVRGVLGSIFDYGNVLIQTAGARNEFVFESVRHPQEIAELILDLSDQAKAVFESEGEVRAGEIQPKGDVKGVINDSVFRSLENLRRLGQPMTEQLRRQIGLVSPSMGNTPNSTTPMRAPVPSPMNPAPEPPRESTASSPSEPDIGITIDEPKG